jgi:DNA repair protein RecO (recombination protein O)
MGLGKSAAVVIGSFPLGESDRVVTFYSREYGKIRGVAKSSRRLRSRFAGALELFTLGELIFFDTGKSELVRIDHFDVVRPFAAVRSDLGRLGHAAWMVECVGRLTAEQDRHAGLYGLLVRGLGALERSERPGTVAVAFGLRCLDALGYRPRLDRCGACGRRYPFPQPALDAGGVVCAACARLTRHAWPLGPGAITALARLRALAWDEATAVRLDHLEDALIGALDFVVSSLIGQPTRSPKFLREVSRFTPAAGERP